MQVINKVALSFAPFLIAIILTAAVPLKHPEAASATIETDRSGITEEYSANPYPGFLSEPDDELPICYCPINFVTCLCSFIPIQ